MSKLSLLTFMILKGNNNVAKASMKSLAPQNRLPDDALEMSGGVLKIIQNKEILSINFPLSSEGKITKLLKASVAPGKSANFGKHHLLWTEVGQFFCYGDKAPLGEAALAKRVGGAGYVTDLSDGWVAVQLSGAQAQNMLDQITLPDLSNEAFAIGDVTSTLMTHLRVIIWRNSDTSFTLLSAASSASSFLHALSEELQTASRYLEKHNA